MKEVGPVDGSRVRLRGQGRLLLEDAPTHPEGRGRVSRGGVGARCEQVEGAEWKRLEVGELASRSPTRGPVRVGRRTVGWGCQQGPPDDGRPGTPCSGFGPCPEGHAELWKGSEQTDEMPSLVPSVLPASSHATLTTRP